MGLFIKKNKNKYNLENLKIKTYDKDKGFSLIEVLVAMVILAIVTLPILSTFASAAKVNSNARKQENANAVAQKIIEEFKALPISKLADNNKDVQDNYLINNNATGVANCSIKNATSVANQLLYEFKMASFSTTDNITFTPKTYVTGGNTEPYYEGANGEKFFVKVTLDPSPYADKISPIEATTDNVKNNINSYDMPVIKDVNPDINYVILNQVYQHDRIIVEAFNEKLNDPSIIISDDDITRQVKITSNVTKNGTFYGKTPESSTPVEIQIYKQKLTVEVTYQYKNASNQISYIYDNATFGDTDNIVENAAVINKLNSKNYNEFKNVYLFYKAFDKLNDPANDAININYNYEGDISNDKLQVYLIEQQVGATDTKPLNRNNVKISINGYPVEKLTSGTLHLNKSGLGIPSGAVDIYSNIKEWDSFVTGSPRQDNNITQKKTSSDGTKYLYNIKVEIWVGDDITGAAFVTMTSTKEN